MHTSRNGRPQQRRRPKKGPKPLAAENFIHQAEPQEEQTAYVNQYQFSDFNFDRRLQHNLEVKGYKTPSEIQDKAIKAVLQGQDVLAIAGTGTGKTAAFTLPILQRMVQNKRHSGVLIITPTRELASQIQEEFLSLSKGLGLQSACLIGGTSVRQNLKALARHNHFIIGTPGRLRDMANQGALDFGQFEVLVLDEFDRMLDMGFSKEVLRINSEMRSKKQSLLFSATLDEGQRHLIRQIASKPTEISSSQHTHRSESIDQQAVPTAGKDKFAILTELLQKEKGGKVILFCETKRHADRLSKKLKNQNFSADAIHGNKTQNQRERTLAGFKSGRLNILVATDVIARGIDVQNVDLVINYQAPRQMADYVHRIGRTGRAGKSGRAITLLD